MAEQKHTPGPWALAPYLDCDEVINVVAGYKDLGGGQSQAHWIAECEAGVDFGDDAEAIIATNEANARLIAAAPDLLTACKDALGTLMHEPQITDRALWPLPQTLNMLQSAIAKAEGR